MYGQGAARNPSSIRGPGDRSQPGRYPSRTRSIPLPPPTSEAKRQEKPPEAKQEQSTVGDGAQPSSLPFPQPRSQPPKQEVKQELKSSEAEQEESRVPPLPQEPQLISSASQNESKGRKIIPLKDGVPDEEIQRQKSLQEGIKDDVSNLTRRLAELHGQQKIVASGDQKQPWEEVGVRVITLAGENRGANMDMGSALRKQEMVEIQRGYKLNEENKSADGSGAKSKGKSAPEGNPVNAYVNSNVQGVNNSILYNSSCPQRNPGVHLAVSNNPVSSFRRIEAAPAYPDGKDRSKTTSKSLEMDRAMQTPPAPNQLTVKRRCLRALFLESGTDSDPEINSQRPIRHGCRYQCQRAMANGN